MGDEKTQSPEHVRHFDGKDPAKLGRTIICLILPAWLLLAIELLGGSRYGRTPIHLGSLELLRWLAVAAVFITPVFTVVGFGVALLNRGSLRYRKHWFPALLLLLLVSSLISLLNCAVTFGGHPVWVDGFGK